MKNTANFWPAILGCRAIYRDPEISPEFKLSQIATLLGFEHASVAETATTTATATAQPSAATNTGRQRGRPAGSRNRTRTASRSGGAEMTELERQIYGQVPASGGIQQTSITASGKRPNVVGRVLGGLKRKGLLVEQNGVWERARPAYQEQPAAQAA